MRVASASMGVRDPISLNAVSAFFAAASLRRAWTSDGVSGGLTVGAHHGAPYGWIPTEDGEDRAIIGGVVLLVQAFGGGHVLAVDLHRSRVHQAPIGP